MAPESPLGRQGGASWDSAGCFRFVFAIGGPGAGSSRDWAAKGAVTILTRPGSGWRAGGVRNFRLRPASHIVSCLH